MRLGIRLAVATFAVVTAHLAGFFLVFIVPTFKRRWDNYGVRLPLWKELLIQVSDFMAQWGYLLLPATIVAAALFVFLPLLWNRSAERPTTLDR